MSEVPKRIHGTEMEWSVTVPDPNNVADIVPVTGSSISDYMDSYVRRLSYLGSSANYFLGIGSRYYLDMNKFPEYATPEDVSFLGTTANELVGEQIMHDTFCSESNNHTARETGAITQLSLNKRVIDDNEKTWGYHESYAVDATTGIEVTQEKLALLGVHMATRNIFFGAGVLRPDGTYALAQKSLGLGSDYSTDTLWDKPVVNLRNEPHADKSQWLRVHMTSGDANMSPWATRMKLGTTSLVLRLIEHGDNLGNIRPEVDLHELGKFVAYDIGLKNRYKLKHNGAMTAVQIQRQLMLAASRLAQKVSLPEEELWTLNEWEKACADIQQDSLLLRDRVDWVTKRRLLERSHDRHGFAWDSPQMRGIDRQWDRIGPSSIGIALRETALSKWMPSEALIQERTTTPPQTTRARVRGGFIKAFSGNDISTATVDWSHVVYKGGQIALKNPYVSYNEEVDTIIRENVA
jgi:hypothetical protein